MRQPNTPPDLSRQVRAGFVLQGTSLKSFCRENQIDDSNATKALTGTWKGPKAESLRAFLLAQSQGHTVNTHLI